MTVALERPDAGTPGDRMAHRFLGVDSRRHGHIAACACGWTSLPLGTAGLAGAAWDDHVARVETGDAADPEQDG